MILDLGVFVPIVQARCRGRWTLRCKRLGYGTIGRRPKLVELDGARWASKLLRRLIRLLLRGEVTETGK